MVLTITIRPAYSTKNKAAGGAVADLSGPQGGRAGPPPSRQTERISPQAAENDALAWVHNHGHTVDRCTTRPDCAGCPWITTGVCETGNLLI